MYKTKSHLPCDKRVGVDIVLEGAKVGKQVTLLM